MLGQTELYLAEFKIVTHAILKKKKANHLYLKTSSAAKVSEFCV